MYKTANILPEQIRSRTVRLLNRHLAAAAVVLFASASTLANAAENPARLSCVREVLQKGLVASAVSLFD